MTFSKPAIIGWILFFASLLLWVNQSAERRGWKRGFDSATKSYERIQESVERGHELADSLHEDYYYRLGYQNGMKDRGTQ